MLHKLFSFENSRLIFDLFLENKINKFYESHILNDLTNKLFDTNNSVSNSFKTLYIVQDIPDYLILDYRKLNNSIHFKEVKQYKGYLVNLTRFNSANTFINKTLNKRNRKNLNSKKSNLYKHHKISSKVFFGNMTKSEYDTIFETFYILLKNRFKEKQTHNRYLSNWEDLQNSTFQKILDKQASLHIIYDDLKPIAITLNFHKGDIIFSHIQTYDIDYSKYNMGDISMTNHLEWLIKSDIDIFDLSMGKTYYKNKWCNHTYTIKYHIFYNKKSLLSKLCANIIAKELWLIQFLRDKHVIGKFINFDKFLYYYKSNIAK